VRRLSDLFHPRAGPFAGRPPILSVPVGAPLPTLAEHFRRGLRVVAQPGTRFAYSNHGYATLGQIVEDVSGISLERYLRERIFEPLGLADTDLVRTRRIASRLATGYAFRRSGVTAVPDRDWIGPGCGGMYSTARDLARFAAALTGGNDAHNRFLRPVTLATMFEPHFRPDPRIPGWGLGFARSDAGGRRVVGHDGILPGFNTTLWAAPADGVAVVALTNGSTGAMQWLDAEFVGLLRDLLGVPGDVIRTDIPHRPEIWSRLCGRYRLPPRISDLRGRLAMPGGVEVLVRGGRLMLRASTPVPALRQSLALHPDAADDPYVFRLDLSAAGMGAARVVFGRDLASDAPAMHLDLGGQPVSLVRHLLTTRRRSPERTAEVMAAVRDFIRPDTGPPGDSGSAVT
jgi:hypothetical protein